jgi:hypothetical protein
MPTLKLIAEPTSVTSHWLRDHFDGETTVAEFAAHFSANYVTKHGTCIPVKNVYARILRDERRGLVTRSG